MFLGHDSPDDTRTSTLPLVVQKIKGSPYRREITRVVNGFERKPLQWHAQTFNQVHKLVFSFNVYSGYSKTDKIIKYF